LIESIKTAAFVYFIAAIVAILVALYIKLVVFYLHRRNGKNKTVLSPVVLKDVPKIKA
jgi:hypothetical protein